jgi:hypothetical protein
MVSGRVLEKAKAKGSTPNTARGGIGIGGASGLCEPFRQREQRFITADLTSCTTQQSQSWKECKLKGVLP